MNLRRKNLRLYFVASDSSKARRTRLALIARYDQAPVAEADANIAIGGDGFMLQTPHRHMKHSLPTLGINRGTVGCLMNEYREDGLLQRIRSAVMGMLMIGREHV